MRKESSTNFENEKAIQEYCGAFKIISQISGRWKLLILFALQESNKSYTDFKKLLKNVSDRMLTKQLNELIQDGLIIKEKTKTTANYSLSNYGEGFAVVLNSLKKVAFTEAV